MKTIKTLKTALLFALALFLVVIACDKDPIGAGLEGPNETHWGSPFDLHVAHVDPDERDFWFGLIADTHIDASSCELCPWGGGHPYRDTDKVKRNRNCIDDMNADNFWAQMKGIVHVGDMVDAHSVQNLVAFRQLWEDDYPGHDGGSIKGTSDDNTDYKKAYSQGYRINIPVFPGIGNHDDPDGHYLEWPYAMRYFRERGGYSTGMVSAYLDTGMAYCWRWGKYFFIQLGQWAGSPCVERHPYSRPKLEWLENVLSTYVADSGLGVVIFQHYGWDHDGSYDYWTEDHKRLMLNILCRRPMDVGLDEQLGNPYNVLAIFTGHTHNQNFDIRPYAGKDTNNVPIHFRNLVLQAAGALDTGGNYGYYLVHFIDGVKMHIKLKHVNSGHWFTWEYDISIPR